MDTFFVFCFLLLFFFFFIVGLAGIFTSSHSFGRLVSVFLNTFQKITHKRKLCTTSSSYTYTTRWSVFRPNKTMKRSNSKQYNYEKYHRCERAAQRDTENQKLCAQQFKVFYIKCTHFTAASLEPYVFT